MMRALPFRTFRHLTSKMTESTRNYMRLAASDLALCVREPVTCEGEGVKWM